MIKKKMGADIRQEIYRLACLKVTPREIEIALGLPPYRIHETYHAELMRGYREAEIISISKINNPPVNKEDKRKKSNYWNVYYRENRTSLLEKQRRYRLRRKQRELENEKNII